MASVLNGRPMSGSSTTCGTAQSHNATSAVDLTHSDDDSGSGGPPAKKRTVEIKAEPNLDDASCTGLKQVTVRTCSGDQSTKREDSSSCQMGGENVGAATVSRANNLPICSEPPEAGSRVFRCWLCDFTYKDSTEIDQHLRKVYSRENEVQHSHFNILSVFNLYNPAVLILSEMATVYLKCLKCDEIHSKLSMYLIHAMMYCPFSSGQNGQQINYQGINKVNTFDVIKCVEKGALIKEQDREVIRGANEMSICGQVECGALLNRFDARPHKCKNGRATNVSKLKCHFYKCEFEGDKKTLINHYSCEHLIKLSNVKYQQDESTFLQINRSPNVDHLIEGPVGLTLQQAQAAATRLPLNHSINNMPPPSNGASLASNSPIGSNLVGVGASYVVTQRDTILQGSVGSNEAIGPPIQPQQQLMSLPPRSDISSVPSPRNRPNIFVNQSSVTSSGGVGATNGSVPRITQSGRGVPNVTMRPNYNNTQINQSNAPLRVQSDLSQPNRTAYRPYTPSQVTSQQYQTVNNNSPLPSYGSSASCFSAYSQTGARTVPAQVIVQSSDGTIISRLPAPDQQQQQQQSYVPPQSRFINPNNQTIRTQPAAQPVSNSNQFSNAAGSNCQYINNWPP